MIGRRDSGGTGMLIDSAFNRTIESLSRAAGQFLMEAERARSAGSLNSIDVPKVTYWVDGGLAYLVRTIEKRATALATGVQPTYTLPVVQRPGSPVTTPETLHTAARRLTEASAVLGAQLTRLDT